LRIKQGSIIIRLTWWMKTAMEEHTLKQLDTLNVRVSKLGLDDIRLEDGLKEDPSPNIDKRQAENSNMLTNLAHDLRTACHGMICFAKLLYEEEESVQKQEKLKFMLDSSGSLYHWIDQALDYVRHNNSENPVHLNEKVASLSQLINQIITSLLPLINIKQINVIEYIDPKIPKKMIFHAYSLRRILMHLIENAIKFNHYEGMVSIDVMYQRTLGDTVRLRFSIKDTGFGIAQDKQEDIFKPFIRLHSSYKDHYPGIGMGLAVVVSLLKSLGGSIHLNSIVGQGTEFYFELDFKLASSYGTLVANDNESLNKKSNISQLNLPEHLHHKRMHDLSRKVKRVLVIEDEKICQRIAVFLLEKFGCEVKIASTASEATTLVMQESFDFILMDIGLPDLSGVELVKVIRSLRGYSDIIIVALTAHLDFCEKKDVCNAGFSDVLIKPLKVQLIEKYFQKKNLVQ
jgi:signal transduction histidine kinase/ActR/RegA family two-component response regulator